MKIKYIFVIKTTKNNKTLYLQDRKQFGKDLWTSKIEYAQTFKDYKSASDLFRKYGLSVDEYEIEGRKL